MIRWKASFHFDTVYVLSKLIKKYQAFRFPARPDQLNSQITITVRSYVPVNSSNCWKEKQLLMIITAVGEFDT